MTFTVRILDAIADVDASAWDALVDDAATPLVRHAFLDALESSGCAVAEAGWRARHVTLWRDGTLVAAAPAYLHDSSDGDFARDWDWAAAAERARIRWYPKLCITVPFSPVTGRRLLTRPGEARAPLVRALVDAARDLAKDEGCGTLQVLFPTRAEADELESLGFAVRMSYQFHWQNDGYKDSDEFLARFSSKRRNQLRRERRAPGEQGIAIRTVRQGELAAEWRRYARVAHELHASTIEKLPWGRGWLNHGFYERAFATMSDNMELVVAERAGRIVAGAVNVASRTRLYGRYWGCFEEHPFLHFNVCLYHSVDDCIRRGLVAFEGGAGGDHKLARGFEPAETWSAHLVFHKRLDDAVRASLVHERAELDASLARWRAESPILRRAATGERARDGLD